MATQVLMPQLGESVVEGTITKWLKAKGDRVEEYEPLLEVNTDKVDTEVPSPTSGILLDILVSEGTTVQAGTLLAMVGETDEQALTNEPRPPAAVRERQAESIALESAAEGTPQVASTAPPTPGRDPGLGFISPVVAKIAREENIDLRQVEGTGQGGRITKQDILNYLEQSRAAPSAAPASDREVQPQTNGKKEYSAPAEAPVVEPDVLRQAQPVPRAQPMPQVQPVPGEVVPLTSVRKAIAEHMVYSKHTSPHVTTVMEVDLQQVTRHRQVNKDAFMRDGVNLTFTAYFISALVGALKAHPIVNSSWSDEGLIYHREINIGMATSLGEAGLIVPVIKQADSLSLLGIARAINDLSNRARARQLKPDEVKGGTFTITNHGVTGSLFATPIINQPQCGILGVGAIQKRVVVIDDAIAIRPMAYLTLTFDHRILDGAVADYFLGKVVELLQHWT